MNNVNEYKAEKVQKKISNVAAIRTLIQLFSFILIPGLFITIFSGMKEIWQSTVTGTFVFDDQIGNILLTVGMLVITFIWGRFFCGFICSFGAMQDLLWLGGKHIPAHPRISEKADRVLKYFKYAVLAFVVIGIWTLGVGSDSVWSPWTVFGMYASPWKGLPTEAVFLSVGGLLLLITVIGSVFVERFFCKYLCPLGAIFTLMSRFRIFKLKRKVSSCSGQCRLCTRKCSMSIPLYKHEKVESGECIDCMKCTAVCPAENIRADPLSAISGTVAAVAIAGMSFAGTLNTSTESTIEVSYGYAQIENADETNNTVDSKYDDGTYTGTASGYRGQISVSVTVSGGSITDITVTSAKDDQQFLSQAKDGVIPAIISQQSTDVNTVSGATFSSRGIINAVKNALENQLVTTDESANGSESEYVRDDMTETEPFTTKPQEQTDNFDDDEKKARLANLADGVYTGTGTGFRGTTAVSVTIKDDRIENITVTSYQDDRQYFSRAESGVINAIISSQSVNVSAVSGATFSSNSIIEAVADAIGEDFTNPNSSMSRGHGHKH